MYELKVLIKIKGEIIFEIIYEIEELNAIPTTLNTIYFFNSINISH